VHIAAKRGYIKIMEELLKSESGRSILEAVDANEQTPLHYAAKNNQPEMIKFLLDK
jgi:ankyrin repeat protein